MGVLRLFLALSVVIWHIPGQHTYLVHGGVAVVLFFIVSGFYMALVINEKYGSDIKAFYRARFLRIFPMYWAAIALMLAWALWWNRGASLINSSIDGAPYSALWFMNLFIFGQAEYQAIGDAIRAGRPDVIAAAAATFFPTDFFSPQWTLIGQAWSLEPELFFYLLAPFVVRSVPKMIALFVASTIFRFVLTAYPGGFDGSGWAPRAFPFALGWFLLGSLAYRLYPHLKRYRHAEKLASLVCAGMIAAFAIGYFEDGIILPPGRYTYDSPTIAISFVLFAMALPFLFLKSKNSKVDRFIGDLSYPLYLVHGLVLGVALSILGYGEITAVVLSLVAAFLLSVVIERPMDLWRHSRRHFGLFTELLSGRKPANGPQTTFQTQSALMKNQTVENADSTSMNSRDRRHSTAFMSGRIFGKTRLFFTDNYAVVLILACSVFVFLPFFTGGKIMLTNTDTLFNHYPNLIFGNWAIHNGSLGLWNPYVFAGMDFTATMHNHALNPIFWPALALPEAYLLEGLTFFLFLCHFVIGWSALRIARLYLTTASATLFAVTAQLSGFVWFTTTSTIALPMCAASTIAIYLILTAKKRSAVHSFAALTLALAPITMMGHGGYILAFVLPVAVTLAIRFWPHRISDLARARPIALVAAFFAATAIGYFRLAAVLEFFSNDAHTGEFGGLTHILTQPSDVAYYVLTAFAPNLLGYRLSESSLFSDLIGVTGLHIQFHASFYFGAIPFLLALLALTGRFGLHARLSAIVFAIFFCAHPPFIMPAFDLISVLLFPFQHQITIRSFAPYAFATTVLFSLIHLERTPASQRFVQDQRWRAVPLTAIGTVLLLITIFATKVLTMPQVAAVVFPKNPWMRDEPFAAKLIGLGLITLTGLLVWRSRRDHTQRDVRTLVNWSIFLCLSSLVGILALSVVRGWFATMDLALYGFMNDLGAIFSAMACVVWARHISQPTNARSMQIPPMAIALLAIAFVLLMLDVTSGTQNRELGALSLASAISVVRFVAVWICAVEILCAIGQAGIHRKKWIVLLIVFTLGDLLFFNKNYFYTGADPFVSVDKLYPPLPSFQKKPGSENAPGGTSLSLPNLLQNPGLTATGNSTPEGWHLGGKAPSLDVASPAANNNTTFRSQADDLAAVFQDHMWNARPGPVTIGAWMRAAPSDEAGLLLTTTKEARSRYSGEGAWQWVTATIQAEENQRLRVHIYLKNPGSVEFAGLRLVTGNVAEPTIPSPGPAVANSAERGGSGNPDLVRYRMNNPGRLPGFLTGQAFSSIPMVYGISTYGGADSAVRRSLADYLQYFETSVPKEKWLARYGVLPTLENPRLLDLLGVKYNVTKEGRIVTRPNALARISIFDAFEVRPDQGDALQRLRDPAFAANRTVVLDTDPDWSSPAEEGAEAFRAPTFKSPTFESVNVSINSEKPQIVLFNDVYSRYWRATWNGKQLPIMHANGLFMAVSIPTGQGMLSFDFVPEQFIAMMRMSYAALGLMVLLLAGCTWLEYRARRTSLYS